MSGVGVRAGGQETTAAAAPAAPTATWAAVTASALAASSASILAISAARASSAAFSAAAIAAASSAAAFSAVAFSTAAFSTAAFSAAAFSAAAFSAASFAAAAAASSAAVFSAAASSAAATSLEPGSSASDSFCTLAGAVEESGLSSICSTSSFASPSSIEGAAIAKNIIFQCSIHALRINSLHVFSKKISLSLVSLMLFLVSYAERAIHSSHLADQAL